MSDACGSPLLLTPRHCGGSMVRATILLLGVFATLSLATIGYAQNDAAGEFDVDEPAAAVEAEAPVADEGDDAADQPETDGAKKKPPTLLKWVFDSLGWGYLLIFLAISVTLVSLFVMNMLAARRDTLCPQELVDQFEEKLNEKDYQGAYDMARTDESVLGQVLSAGLAKLSRGYNKAIEGMQEVGEEESMKLEHRLSYMALIGNISPMIGLFGTVHGMIEAFQVIALGGATPKPAELAEGISTALFTTLVGLAIAIPAIAAYNVIRNRVSRLLLEVGVTSENLMSRFEDSQPQGGKK